HRKIQFLEEERARLAAVAAREAPADVWSSILDRIKVKVTGHEVRTWFVQATLLRDDGAVITIAAPKVHVQWIQTHHADVVREAIEEVRPGATVTFVA